MKKIMLSILLLGCASLMAMEYDETQKRILKNTIELNGWVCRTVDAVRSQRGAKHKVICDGYARVYVIDASRRPWKVSQQ